MNKVVSNISPLSFTRDGPRILLGFAFAFFLVHYMPMWVINGINSDMLIPVVFYEDVFKEGHSVQDWVWGGASFLFPDLLLICFLNFLTDNGIAALECAGIIYFLAWPSLLVAIYRFAGGRRTEVFATFSILFAVLVSSPPGLHAGLTPYRTFCHSGSFLVVLAALAVTQMILAKRRIFLFVVLTVLVVLGTASDALIIPQFVIAASGALAIKACVIRDQWRSFSALGLTILISGVAGFFFEQLFFPIRLAPNYTEARLGAFPASLRVLWNNLSFPHETLRTCLVISDFVSVPLLTWLLCRSHSSTCFVRPGFYFVVVFSIFLIVCTWLATLVSGNYTDLGSTRYVVLPMLVPGLLLIGWLSEAFSWGNGSCSFLTTGVAIFVGFVALQSLDPSSDVSLAPAFSSLMQGIMARNHIDAGLAGYWQANSFTYLTNQLMPVRSINQSGSVYRWFNNAEWYEGNGTTPPPAFGFVILSQTSDTMPLLQRYGLPTQKLRGPGGFDVWLYAPEHPIQFNPIFGELGNARTFPRPTELRLSASALDTQSGIAKDSTIEAEKFKTKVGCFLWGPAVHPVAGRYRVNYDYTYEQSPAPGQEATFDCMIQTRVGEKIIDHAILPWTGVGPKNLTRTIVLSKGDSRASLQARLFYNGSGSIRVYALTIDYLGG